MRKTIIIGNVTSKGSRLPLQVKDRYFLKKLDTASKKRFSDQHFSELTMFFISKDIYQKFNNIVTKARRRLDTFSVVHEKLGVRYMTKESLQSFAIIFDEYKREYNDYLDELEKEYNELKKEFLKGYCEFIDDPIERKKEKQRLDAEIIPFKHVRDKFEISLETMEINVEVNFYLETLFIRKSLGHIQDVVDSLTTAINSNDPTRLKKALTHVEDKISKITEFNLTRNQVIRDIVADIQSILKHKGKGQTTKVCIDSIKMEVVNLFRRY